MIGIVAGLCSAWVDAAGGLRSDSLVDDLTQAQEVLDQALAKAAEIDTLMNVAVVEAGCNLKAFGRMDGAWLGSIDISIKKARTARLFDMSTGDIGELSQPGGPLYNIDVSNNGLITPAASPSLTPRARSSALSVSAATSSKTTTPSSRPRPSRCRRLL